MVTIGLTLIGVGLIFLWCLVRISRQSEDLAQEMLVIEDASLEE